MRAADDPHPDGPDNILSAAIVDADPRSSGQGVLVAFNRQARTHPAGSAVPVTRQGADVVVEGERGPTTDQDVVHCAALEQGWIGSDSGNCLLIHLFVFIQFFPAARVLITYSPKWSIAFVMATHELTTYSSTCLIAFVPAT